MVLTELSPMFMNKSFKNRNFENFKTENLNWNLVQSEMKKRLGLDIYESWLKKIEFV